MVSEAPLLGFPFSPHPFLLATQSPVILRCLPERCLQGSPFLLGDLPLGLDDPPSLHTYLDAEGISTHQLYIVFAHPMLRAPRQLTRGSQARTRTQLAPLDYGDPDSTDDFLQRFTYDQNRRQH